jgi:hypothetical protein
MELTEEEFDKYLERMKRYNMVNWDGTRDGSISLTKDGKKMIKKGAMIDTYSLANILAQILYHHDKITGDQLFEYLITEHGMYVEADKFDKAFGLLVDNNLIETK